MVRTLLQLETSLVGAALSVFACHNHRDGLVIARLRAVRERGIDQIMDLVFDLAGMRVDPPWERPIDQPLREQDVIEQDMRITARINKVLEINTPPKLVREIEQRVVQEPARGEDVSLDVGDQIEEEKLLFEVLLAWPVV